MEKTFSGQNFVFLRLRRQHPCLHKTKGPTRNPISPTPPPSFGGRPCHPPPPPQSKFQVALGLLRDVESYSTPWTGVHLLVGHALLAPGLIQWWATGQQACLAPSLCWLSPDFCGRPNLGRPSIAALPLAFLDATLAASVTLKIVEWWTRVVREGRKGVWREVEVAGACGIWRRDAEGGVVGCRVARGVEGGERW